MPPGNLRPKAPNRILERVTAEACLAIARQVQAAHDRSGDGAGARAAGQIVEAIQHELLLDPGPGGNG